MVGTYRRWGFSFLGCALLAISIAGSAWGESVKGRSRDLGIQFEVKGGAKWCTPNVVVDLTAERADAFKPDTLPFVQMLGRISAIVMDQRPSVERLAFDGKADKRSVLSMEMTRLTNWRRIVVINLWTQRPPCPTQEPSTSECVKRADAYVFMHDTMRGGEFSGAELITSVNEQDTAHAVWVLGDVVGKLTIRGRNEYAGRFTSSGELAEAVLFGLVDECRRGGASPEGVWSENVANLPDRAMRGFSCRPSSDARSNQAFVVMSRGELFYVFTLLDAGSDAGVVKSAAQELAHAIGNSK